MDGKPELQLEKPQYSLGEKLRANCSSPPSNPPANITWFINDKEVKSQNHNNAIYITYYFDVLPCTRRRKKKLLYYSRHIKRQKKKKEK